MQEYNSIRLKARGYLQSPFCKMAGDARKVLRVNGEKEGATRCTEEVPSRRSEFSETVERAKFLNLWRAGKGWLAGKRQQAVVSKVVFDYRGQGFACRKKGAT